MGMNCKATLLFVAIASLSPVDGYVITPFEWPKDTLYYKWIRYSERWMNRHEIRQAIEQAFDMWSRVTPLNFRETSGPADIELAFVKQGDPERCSSQSKQYGMLAHAIFRQFAEPNAGNIHFDDADAWGVKDQRSPFRIGLMGTAAHEIGHMLGLTHSSDSYAVMNPGRENVNELGHDDIEAVQKMYGSRRDGSSIKIEHNTCGLRFNDVSTSLAGDVHVFAGQYYYLLTQNGLAKKRRITDWFKGAPSSPDAVMFYRLAATIYMFKGQYFYTFNYDYTMDDDSPKLLPSQFQDIDAAVMGSDKEFYLFKGNRVAKWDPYIGRNGRVNSKSLTSMFGNNAPQRVDAALYFDERIYLFNGDRYWKYEDNYGREQLAYGYPKSILPFWLGCGHLSSRDMEPVFRD